MAAAIEVTSVTKRYPVARPLRELLRHPTRRRWTDALRGVSVRVERGTVHGLLGANGAGKTTLLKILATLVVPTSGMASVAGHDVSKEPARVRTKLGYVVADERSFYWRLDGRANLLFFAALHDITGDRARQRVDELLRVVGLEEVASRPFREYSTGMRQRLAIARGLLSRPDVILMDEPTRALDPPSAAWIRRFAREQLVAGEGATVILATHDLREVETTCDRLTLVDKGLVVAEGTVAELKRPLDRAARSIIDVECPDDALVARLRSGLLGENVDISREGDACRLLVPGTGADVAAHVRTLVLAGARVVGVRAEEGDLSELFERMAPFGGDRATP